MLDSFSRQSSDALEKLLESESGNSKSVSKNLGLKLPFKKPGSGLDLNIAAQIASHSKTLNRALTKHVEESQSVRSVEVKIETTETFREGEEVATVREVRNINQSRVLNFIFRQLNQEYVTVTYAEDVSLIFTNGNDLAEDMAKLADMETFLAKYIDDETVRDTIARTVIVMLANFSDHRGECRSLIRKVEQELIDPETGNRWEDPTGRGGGMVRYWVKDQDLKQDAGVSGVTVPGIITQIEHFVLSTDSVVVDALLGQGEALDCYNTQLQHLAILKDKAAILGEVQKMQVIGHLELRDPNVFDKVFGECCCDNGKAGE